MKIKQEHFKINDREEDIVSMQYGHISELYINIDMVNGFVKEGPLAAPSIMRVVPRQKEIINEFIISPDKGVFFIRDCHSDDSVEFKTFGKHCIKGTKETEIIDELKEYEPYVNTYFKNSTNFVFANGFQEDIARLKNLKKVILGGCLSEVCVKNGGITLRNLFDEQNRDIEIYVARDAIDTYDAPGHNSHEVTERALADMQANGIKIYRK